MDIDNPSNNDNEYTLELYKSLRAEVVAYMDKVPGLWLQKFILVGAVIAFLLGKSDALTKIASDNRIIIASILSIPALAILLDSKMLEYGLQARAISKFIGVNFKDQSIIAKWEKSLWGDEGDAEILKLVNLRSFTTILVTAAPTAILILLSGVVLSEVTKASWFWLSLAVVGTVIYLLASLLVWQKIWART